MPISRTVASLTALLQQSNRSKASKRSKTAKRSRKNQELALERLEDRMVLAADLVYSALAAGPSDLTVQVSQGMVQIVETDDPTNVLAEKERSQFTGDGVQINGGGVDVELTIDSTAATITQGIEFVGGSGADTLNSELSSPTWTLSGANSGTVDSLVTFSGVETLSGSGSDTYQLGAPFGTIAIDDPDGGTLDFSTVFLSTSGNSVSVSINANGDTVYEGFDSSGVSLGTLTVDSTSGPVSSDLSLPAAVNLSQVSEGFGWLSDLGNNIDTFDPRLSSSIPLLAERSLGELIDVGGVIDSGLQNPLETYVANTNSPTLEGLVAALSQSNGVDLTANLNGNVLTLGVELSVSKTLQGVELALGETVEEFLVAQNLDGTLETVLDWSFQVEFDGDAGSAAVDKIAVDFTSGTSSDLTIQARINESNPQFTASAGVLGLEIGQTGTSSIKLEGNTADSFVTWAIDTSSIGSAAVRDAIQGADVAGFTQLNPNAQANIVIDLFATAPGVTGISATPELHFADDIFDATTPPAIVETTNPGAANTTNLASLGIDDFSNTDPGTILTQLDQLRNFLLFFDTNGLVNGVPLAEGTTLDEVLDLKTLYEEQVFDLLTVEAFTTSTTLASLNAGRGVRTVAGADFEIMLSDGSTFQVDLDSPTAVTTIGELFARLNAAATAAGVASSFEVRLDPNLGGFLLIDKAGGQRTPTVTAINGSPTIKDLGLIDPAAVTEVDGVQRPVISASIGFQGPSFRTVQELATTLGISTSLAFDSAGRLLSIPLSISLAPSVITGTVTTAVDSSTFEDSAADFGDADSLVGRKIVITSGAGAGQFRTITSNIVDEVGGQPTITVDSPWTVALDTTSQYEITASYISDLGLFDVDPLVDLTSTSQIEVTPTGTLDIPFELILTPIGGTISESSPISALSAGVGVRATDGEAAGALFTLSSNAQAGETIEIGTAVYTFQTTLSTAGDVLIGATLEDTLANLRAAINGDVGAGTLYGSGTARNSDVSALTTAAPETIQVVARFAGTAANGLPLISTSGSGQWDSGELTGGSVADDIQIQLANGTSFSVDLDHTPAEVTLASLGLTTNFGSDDLQITLSNGSSFSVNLDTATLLGDAVILIESAFARFAATTPSVEADDFEIRIDTAAGTFEFVDFTDPASVNPLSFSSLGSSNAATALDLDSAAQLQLISDSQESDAEAYVTTASYGTLGDLLTQIRTAWAAYAAANSLNTSDFVVRLNANSDGLVILDGTSPTPRNVTATVGATTADSITFSTASLASLPADLTGSTIRFTWTDGNGTDRFEVREVASQSSSGSNTVLTLTLGWDPDDSDLTPTGSVQLELPTTVTGLNGSSAQADLGFVFPGDTQELTADTPVTQIGLGYQLAVGNDVQVQLADGTTFEVDVDGAQTVGDALDAVAAAAPLAGSLQSIVDLSNGNRVLADFTTGSSSFQITSINGSNVAESLFGSTTTGSPQAEISLFTGTVQTQVSTLVFLDAEFDPGFLVGKRLKIGSQIRMITANVGNLVSVASPFSTSDTDYEILEPQPLVLSAGGPRVQIVNGADLDGDEPGRHAAIRTSPNSSPELTVNLALSTSSLATGIDATGNWGPFGVGVSSTDTGSVTGSAVATVKLDDPGNEAGLGLATLAELAAALGNISTVIQAETVSGTVDVDLPIRLSPTVASSSLNALTDPVRWQAAGADITDPAASLNTVVLSSTGTSPSDDLVSLLNAFGEVSVEDVVAGIISSTEYLADLENLAQLGGNENLLAFQVPGLGMTVAELVGLGSTFDDLLVALEEGEPQTLQDVETILSQVISTEFSGSGSPALTLTHDTSAGAIKIGLSGLDLASTTQDIPFFLDLTKLNNADLAGLGLTSASIIMDGGDVITEYVSATFGGTLDLNLGIQAPVTGTATSSNATNTLTDSTAAFTSDLVGLSVSIVAGTGAGQTRTITGATGTQLTLDQNWATGIDNTSEYLIRRSFVYGAADGSETIVALDLEAGQSDLDFNALFRSTQVSIVDGTYLLSKQGDSSSPAAWTATLDQDQTAGTAAASTTTTLDAELDLSLPLSFPPPLETPAAPIALTIPDLAAGSLSSFTLTGPNSTVDQILSGVDLRENLDGFRIGFQILTDQLDELLDKALFEDNLTTNDPENLLPLVGNQFAESIDFVDQIRDKMSDNLETVSATLTPELARLALFESFGPGGLNWLQDTNNDGQATIEDITLVATQNLVTFDLDLKATQTLAIPMEFVLGVPDVDFDLNTFVEATASFEMPLRLGFSNGADGTFLATDSTTALTGTATSASATNSLTDTSASPSFGSALVGRQVTITEGTGAGQTRTITSATTTTLTLDEAWTTPIATDSKYEISNYELVLEVDVRLPQLASGTATSGTSKTLVDDSASFQRSLVGQRVTITGGTGSGQTRIIAAVDSPTELTVSGDWDTVPNSTSTYQVENFTGELGFLPFQVSENQDPVVATVASTSMQSATYSVSQTATQRNSAQDEFTLSFDTSGWLPTGGATITVTTLDGGLVSLDGGFIGSISNKDSDNSITITVSKESIQRAAEDGTVTIKFFRSTSAFGEDVTVQLSFSGTNGVTVTGAAGSGFDAGFIGAEVISPDGTELRTVTGVSGQTLTLNQPLTTPPSVNDTFVVRQDFESGISGTTFLRGGYAIDLVDVNQRLSTTELMSATTASDPFAESVTIVDGAFAGEADLNLQLVTDLPDTAAFIPYRLVLNLPETANWRFSTSDIAYGGNRPSLSFDNVNFDLVGFMQDFVGPALERFLKGIEPIKGVIDFLNGPVAPYISIFAARASYVNFTSVNGGDADIGNFSGAIGAIDAVVNGGDPFIGIGLSQNILEAIFGFGFRERFTLPGLSSLSGEVWIKMGSFEKAWNTPIAKSNAEIIPFGNYDDFSVDGVGSIVEQIRRISQDGSNQAAQNAARSFIITQFLPGTLVPGLFFNRLLQAAVVGTEAISFPLLNDPFNSFELLLGETKFGGASTAEDALLLSYDTPELFVFLQKAIPLVFPEVIVQLLEPLPIALVASKFLPKIQTIKPILIVGFQAQADYAIAYDATGLETFAKTKNPNDIINGFYFDDRNGIAPRGSSANADLIGDDREQSRIVGLFGLGIQLDFDLKLIFLRPSVELIFGLGESLNFRDPNGDGKLRADEFDLLLINGANEGKPLRRTLYDVGLAIDVTLDFVLQIYVGPFSLVDFRASIFSITSTIDLSLDGPSTTPPTLGSTSTGSLSGDVAGFFSSIGVSTTGLTILDLSLGSSSTQSFYVGAGSSDGEVVVSRTVELSNSPTTSSVYTSSATFTGVDVVRAIGTTGVDRVFVSDALTSPFIFQGGDSADVFYGGGGPAYVQGGDGNDTLFGSLLADLIFGGAGIDIIFGLFGDDQLVGGQGSDIIIDSLGTNRIYGDDKSGSSGSADFIRGGAGDDTIIAGAGADDVDGGYGNDRIEGEGGNDIIRGGDGRDTIFGGSGADDIRGGLGNDTIDGGANNDTIFGDEHRDFITGGLGDDILDGNGASDFVYGDQGPGQSTASDGNDVITAKDGNDFLDGQSGSDTYLLNFAGGLSNSLITVIDTGSAQGTDRFTATGTVLDDEILVRANNDGSRAFVALINSPTQVERVDYNGIERIVIDGSLGNDFFAVDDTAAEVTLSGGAGNDTFQIGQLFRSRRTNVAANVSVGDEFATIETTRGFLSNGISFPMTVNGGTGDDTFIVYHNRAVLSLNGDAGDDVFEIKAFALAGSEEPQRERTDISGGEGADLVQYAVNAPVNIDGGDGFDILVAIGTEFGDDFVITEDGVFGAGLNVSFVNIESLRVDGAEGDDRFFIKSTNENVVTEIFGGLGNDTFNASGDTPPVISNDLLGHSGIITHDVEVSDPANDSAFANLEINGISANVADNDEPGVAIRQTDGATIITEGGLADTYEVVLTSQPTVNIFVKALAPLPSNDARERRSRAFAVTSSEAGAVVDPDGSGVTLLFTPSNWFTPQTVSVVADSTSYTDAAGLLTRPELGDSTSFTYDDDAEEGQQFGFINHLVFADISSEQGGLSLTGVSSLNDAKEVILEVDGTVAENDVFTVTIGGDTVSYTALDGDDQAAVLAGLETAIDDASLTDPITAFRARENKISLPTGLSAGDTFSVEFDTLDRTFTYTLGNSDTGAQFADNFARFLRSQNLVGVSVEANTELAGGGGFVLVTDLTLDTLVLSNTGTATVAASNTVDDRLILLSDDADILTPDETNFTVSDTSTADLTIRLDGGNGNKVVVTAADLGVNADIIGRSFIVTGGPAAGQSRFVIARNGNVLTLDRPWDSGDLPSSESTFLIRVDDAVVGTGATVENTNFTFTDSTNPFPTAGAGLTGRVIQIIGGAGSGQERLILSNTASTLTLNGAWSVEPDATSIYRIERFDGLAVPSVQVEINDNDQVGLIITESGAETSVIEGSDGDQAGEQDTISVRLTKNPSSELTVTLANPDGDLNLSTNTLTFGTSTGTTPQIVTISAAADTVREGFHTGLITFAFPNSGFADSTLTNTDTITVPVDEPVALVGLSFVPASVNSVKVDGVTLANTDYVVIDNKVLFIDSVSQDSVARSGVIEVAYSYTQLGFSNALAPSVLARIADDDSPTVLVRESGGSTNVIESASPTSIATDSYELVLTAAPTGTVTVTVTPEITKTTRTGGIRNDLVQVEVSSTDGRFANNYQVALSGTVEAGDVYELDIAGAKVSYTVLATDSTLADVAAGLKAAVDAAVVATTLSDVTADDSAGDGTLTIAAGAARTVSAQVTTNGANADAVMMVTFPEQTVTFSSSDWDDPVQVDVAAIDDAVVDGGDTKVFAPGPNTLSNILGPVILEGGGGDGSLGVEDPLLLPGETNVKPADGNVVDLSSTQLTVLDSDLAPVLTRLGLGSVSELVDSTLEVTTSTVDSAVGSFRRIVNVAPGTSAGQTVLTLNESFFENIDRYTLTLSGTVEAGDQFTVFIEETPVTYTVSSEASIDEIASGLTTAIQSVNFPGVAVSVNGAVISLVVEPTVDVAATITADGSTTDSNIALNLLARSPLDQTQVTQYAITDESLNFFVEEAEAVDVLFVHDEDSPADSSGTLTSNRLLGFGMGPEGVDGRFFPDPGGRFRPLGITYGGLEVVDIDLGAGGNNLNVLGTHTRDDGYQTWTIIETGDDIPDPNNPTVVGDTVTVSLNETEVVTQTVSAAQFSSATSDPARGLAFLTATSDIFPADGSLTGQLVRIGGPNAEERRIISNTASVLTLEGVWASIPDGSQTIEIINEADGSLALDTQGGDDVINAANSTKGLVLFGGLGKDNITGGSGEDIIFGDRGRVDYYGPLFSNDTTVRPIVTRLGTAPEPILGSVTGDFGDNETLLDSNASFPVPDGFDIGLVGLLVDINNGTGFRQQPRLITDNDATSLFVSPDFSTTLDATSEYRISTVPENQTDGVIRDPNLLTTVDDAQGDVDIIDAGGGNDQVFGGAGADQIHGNLGDDILVGDAGVLERDGTGFDVTFVAGSNAPAVTTQNQRLRTKSPATGSADIISGDIGADTIFGGAGGDTLFGDDSTGSNGEADGADIVFGDFGEINYQDGVVATVATTDPGFGETDSIFTQAGNDIVLGGDNASFEIIDAGTGQNLILGDFGSVDFSLDGDLSTIDQVIAVEDENGQADVITTGDEADLLIGGNGVDIINAGGGDNIILGDTGTITPATGSGPIFGNTSIVIGRIQTTDLNVGSNDILTTGDGNDIILGGLGEDIINAGGGDNIIIGDHGFIDYEFDDSDPTTIDRIETAQPSWGGSDIITTTDGNDIILGGAGGDSIDAGDGSNKILGDNGQATFYDDGTLQFIQSLATSLGGTDQILAGDGPDIVIAGVDDDRVLVGGQSAAIDIVVGDNGEALFNSLGVLVEIRSTAPDDGGDDVISTGEGPDVVIAGSDNEDPSTNDVVLAAASVDANSLNQILLLVSQGLYGQLDPGDAARDVVLGDNGEAIFDALADGTSILREIRSQAADAGGQDIVLTGAGGDILIGGIGDDTLLADGGDAVRDVVVGDSGEALFDAAEVLVEIRSLDMTPGGDDIITTGLGSDVIIGGGDDGDDSTRNDIILAASSVNAANLNSTLNNIDQGLFGQLDTGDAVRDVVLGDNGEAIFDALADGTSVLREFRSEDVNDGGEDIVLTGQGFDIVIGGIGDDTLLADGGDAVRDVVVGDSGEALFDAAEVLVEIRSLDMTPGGDDIITTGLGSDVIIGGGDDGDDSTRNDIILAASSVNAVNLNSTLSKIDQNLFGQLDAGDDARDVVLGDNGEALFDALADGTSVLRTARSSDFTDGGDDLILAGNGFDVVIGGVADDAIIAGGNDAARDVVVGDSGEALFSASEILLTITSLAPNDGGDDIITTGDGPDVVIAGGDDGDQSPNNDTVLASGRGDDVAGVQLLIDQGRFGEIDPGDGARDVVIGDNGQAVFTTAGTLIEIKTSNPSAGGDDILITGNGSDVVLGGVLNDLILADGDDQADDITIGDNGRATFEGTEEYDPGEEFAILSYNLNAGSTYTTVTGTAGAPDARAANWNNLSGGGLRTFGDDPTELHFFDDGRIAPGITIQWGRNLDSNPSGLSTDTHSQIKPNDDQDQRLFEGYLHTSTSNTIGVEIDGLGGHFRSYDVYVYLDADDGRSRRRSSVRSITDGTTTYYLDDPDGNTFTGEYLEVTSTNPLTPQQGNYVVFRGVQGDTFSVRIDDDRTLNRSSQNRPAITGVQVLGRLNPIDRVETTDAASGGNDLIITGGGNDLVLGGSGQDRIETWSNPIFGEIDADVVAGDNARVTISLGEIREVKTTDPVLGLPEDANDSDTILTGNGEDLVFGGNGADVIDSGVEGEFDYGDIKVLSVNFAGNIPESQITGVAGAVAADNWNNLDGLNLSDDDSGDDDDDDDDDDDFRPSQSANDLIFADGASAGNVTIEWGTSLDSSKPRAVGRDTHGQINPDTQNERLFEGYLVTDRNKTLGVDLDGLSNHFTSYDVYVYLDADNGKSRSDQSVRSITDGTTTFFLDDPDGNTFQGEFVEVTSTDPSLPGVGNYVVFRDLSADTLSLRVDDDRTLNSSSSNRPAITGLQIVGGPEKDGVVITGDFERDIVLGDNGIARQFEGEIYEVLSTDLANGPAPFQGDTINTGEDADLIIGGNGDDSINGEAGDDLILGDNARLLLSGGEVIGLEPFDSDEGDDDDDDSNFNPFGVFGIELLGDTVGGNDKLEGERGDDLIYGQFGNDEYLFNGGGLGRDRLVESENPNDSNDRLNFSGLIGAIDVNLGRSGSQTVNGDLFQTDVNSVITLFTPNAFEGVIGSLFSDKIIGNGRDNTLSGLDGNDILEGRKGNDNLLGGEGDDILRGGDDSGDDDDGDDDDGNDVLSGGGGNDVIYAGSGYNLLIGGLGADKLFANSGDDDYGDDDDDDDDDGDRKGDILISGRTLQEDQADSLRSILDDAWIGRLENGESYTAVVDEIVATFFTPGLQVFGEGQKDTLRAGDRSRDLFFAELGLSGDVGDEIRGSRSDRIINLDNFPNS